MANAPWEAVLLPAPGTLVVSLVHRLARIVMPVESERKRDLLLSWICHRERRAKVHERRPARRGNRARSRRRAIAGTMAPARTWSR
ncbi:hypothetical protein AB0O75_05590 [Streptomyces sp. NPDC088921]|uniref:hypothetical protein n=1 Tax=unclassified Streptomyces TaxID=2593676 RepID=UPI00343AB7F2